MKTFIVFAAVLVAVSAQYGDYPNVPMPYSYNYLAAGDEGSSSHQEAGDGNGRVEGSYFLEDIDGRRRDVSYTADENGFRATVRTNEPGTANQNPADVVVESTAPDASGVVGQPPRPVTSRVVPGGFGTVSGGGAGTRYVLVPVTDPRARGYY